MGRCSLLLCLAIAANAAGCGDPPGIPAATPPTPGKTAPPPGDAVADPPAAPSPVDAKPATKPEAKPAPGPGREAAVRAWKDALVRVDRSGFDLWERPIRNADVKIGHYAELLGTRVVATRRDEFGQRYVPVDVLGDGAREAGRMAMNAEIAKELAEVVKARNLAVGMYQLELDASAYKLLDDTQQALVVRHGLADPAALKKAVTWKLPPKGFTAHESKAGGFKVLLAGKVNTYDRPMGFTWRGKERWTQQYMVVTQGTGVRYFDLPDEPTPAELEYLMDAGRSPVRPVTVGKAGIKAVEFIQVLPDGVDTVTVGRVVCFSAGRRIYQLIASGASEAEVRADKAEAFYQSFELTK